MHKFECEVEETEKQLPPINAGLERLNVKMFGKTPVLHVNREACGALAKLFAHLALGDYATGLCCRLSEDASLVRGDGVLAVSMITPMKTAK